jgi:lipid-A-disaccharide synthase
MVVFYKKSNPLLFLVARIILSTRLFSLPNVLARQRVIPEFIPHFGGSLPIIQAVEKLLDDPVAAQNQRNDLDAICRTFDGKNAASLAADSIEEFAGLTKGEPAL